jgi:hypothetical protein
MRLRYMMHIGEPKRVEEGSVEKKVTHKTTPSLNALQTATGRPDTVQSWTFYT